MFRLCFISSRASSEAELPQNNRCMMSLHTCTDLFSRVLCFESAHSDQSAGTASPALLWCLHNTTCAPDFKALSVSVFSTQHKRELDSHHRNVHTARATGDCSVFDQTVEADAPAGQSKTETPKHATRLPNALLCNQL